MSFLTAMIEREEAKGSSWFAGTHLGEFRGDSGREAAQSAIAAMGGVRVKSGPYSVVFGPQALMDIMNFIVTPSLNLGTFYAAGSAFQGKLGQQVAWEGLARA